MNPAGPMLLAYIGPETVLPLTSALAAAGGVLLMFGRRIRDGLLWCLRLVTGRASR